MKGKLQVGSTALVNSLTTLGGFLFAFYLFSGARFLFFTACFLLLLGIYPRVYLRLVSRSFYFINEKEKVVLTNGESGNLHFPFVNQSVLPMLGTCEVTHDPFFQFKGAASSKENRLVFSLTVPPKQSIQMAVPFKTLTRGIGRVHQMTVHMTDPLKLLSVHLYYEFVRQEVVIYPKKKTVYGHEGLQLVKEGSHSHPHSLFVDRSLPIGTRDYVHGDSLKDIHWKATARKGDLQTKLVEKTIGMTWSFVILIGQKMQKETVAQLEEQLSAIARLAELAHKKDIEFNLIINTKPMGRSLILQTPFGTDRAHYFRTMERLAAIQVNFLRIDPKLSIREMSRGLRQPRVLFFAGAVDEVLGDPLVSGWRKRGHHLYKIEPSGAIVPVYKGGEVLAYSSQ